MTTPERARRPTSLVAIVAVLVVTLAVWWYVAGTSSGDSCKMPATPICTAQPHKVGPVDWALAVVAVSLVGLLGMVVIRSRGDRQTDRSG